MKPSTDTAHGKPRGAEGEPKHSKPKAAPGGFGKTIGRITQGVQDFAGGLLKSVSEGFSSGKKAGKGKEGPNPNLGKGPRIEDPMVKEAIDRLFAVQQAKAEKQDKKVFISKSSPDAKHFTIVRKDKAGTPEAEEKCTVEVLSGPNAKDFDGAYKLMQDRFGSEELDPEDIMKGQMEGKRKGYESMGTRAIILAVKNEKGEVIATLDGGLLPLLDEAGKETGESTFMVFYVATSEEYESTGLAGEAMLAAYHEAAKEAQARGLKLIGGSGECTFDTLRYWQTYGWKRAYTQDKAGNFREVPYTQPPLDFDLKTGEVAEGCGDAPEHFMVDLFDKNAEKDPNIATKLAQMVKAFYRANNYVDRRAFETEAAYQKHREAIVPHEQQFLGDLKKGQVKLMSSNEWAGKNIEHWVTPEEYKVAIVEALVSIAAKMGYKVSSEEAEEFIEEETGGEDLLKDDPESEKLVEDMVMGMAKASENPLWTSTTRAQASQLIAIELAKKPWGKPLVEIDSTGRRLDGKDDKKQQKKLSELSPTERKALEDELMERARLSGTKMTREQAAAYIAEAILMEGGNPKKSTETGERRPNEQPADAKKGPEAKETIEKRQAHDVDFIAHLISVNRYISGVKGTTRGMPDGEILIGNQQVRVFAFINSKVGGGQTLREQYEEALRIIDEPVRAKKLSELDRLLSERLILTVGTPEYKTKPDADKGLSGMNADGGARGLKVVERGGRAYIE